MKKLDVYVSEMLYEEIKQGLSDYSKLPKTVQIIGGVLLNPNEVSSICLSEVEEK